MDWTRVLIENLYFYITDFNWGRSKLWAVQRLSCILATRCFPTISLYSVLTLCNVIPIEIGALGIATYLAIKLNLPSNMSHASFLIICLMPRIDIPVQSYFSCPAWLSPNFSVSLRNQENQLCRSMEQQWHLELFFLILMEGACSTQFLGRLCW